MVIHRYVAEAPGEINGASHSPPAGESREFSEIPEVRHYTVSSIKERIQGTECGFESVKGVS